jgi:Mn2+/Fe2+ NRAMP family transporter
VSKETPLFSLASRRQGRAPWLAVIGPGLIAMLADTEAGSIIAAVQSGAQWGYRLVALQFLLVPVLFEAQMLAALLSMARGEGLFAAVRDRLGRPVAALMQGALALSAFATLVIELAGIGGAAACFGLSKGLVSLAAALFVLGVAWLRRFRVVERIAIVVGLGEIAFLFLAWQAAPDVRLIARQAFDWPLGERDYLYLLAANIGTSVIPWALYYQNAASREKRLSLGDRGTVRLETFLGALFCQIVTAALVIAGARLAGNGGESGLGRMDEVARAFTLTLGPMAGGLLFLIGVCGGALVAAIVLAHTMAWAMTEGRTPDWRHFRALFALSLGGAWGLVALVPDSVALALAGGVLNALLLPAMLAVLFFAARRVPELAAHGRGLRGALRGGMFLVVGLLSLYAGIWGSF